MLSVSETSPGRVVSRGVVVTVKLNPQVLPFQAILHYVQDDSILSLLLRNCMIAYTPLAKAVNKYVIAKEQSDCGNPRNKIRSGYMVVRIPIFGYALPLKRERWRAQRGREGATFPGDPSLRSG